MNYRYIAYKSDKTIVTGIQFADNESNAIKIITSYGYKLLNIKPVPAFLPKWDQILVSSKIPVKTIIVFSRQLALLHESGIDIVTALEMLQNQATNPRFKDVLDDLINNIRKGGRLSDAMSKHPNAFSKIYVESVKVGEQAGGIEVMLREMADYMDKEEKTSKSVKNVIRYPAIVAVVAIGVIMLMVAVVFPAFNSLYGQLGAELPLIARIIMSIARWLSENGLYVLIVIAIAAGFSYVWSRTENGKVQRDKLYLKLPLLGNVIHLNELIRCCRSISALYKVGLPIPNALLQAVETSNNVVIKQALIDAHKNVLRGEGLSRSMSKNTVFLPMMVQMVGVGEATGNLESSLSTIADNYEIDVEDKMSNLIGLIQPTITIILAIIIGIIAISLISAMYSLYGQI